MLYLTVGTQSLFSYAYTLSNEKELKQRVNLILVGATGNLAEKYLWQSLFNIYLDVNEENLNREPIEVHIYPAASKSMHNCLCSCDSSCCLGYEDSAWKLEMILDNNVTAETEVEDELKQLFLKERVAAYSQLRSLENYHRMKQRIEQDMNECESCVEVSRLIYLSIPPKFFGAAISNFKAAGILDEEHLVHPGKFGVVGKVKTPSVRVIVEKPFGTNLASATALSETVFSHLNAEQVLLVDHYMGKRGLTAIREFKHRNRHLDEASKSSSTLGSIVEIEVAMLEEETCEKRTWFYEGVGVIRDTMQNHLMMMLALFASHLQAGKPEKESRLAFFKSLKSLRAEDAVLLAQYAGYNEHVLDDGVVDETRFVSTTPTYAELRLSFQNLSHSLLLSSAMFGGYTFSPDTKIVLKSGKALNSRTAYLKASFSDGQMIVFNLQGSNQWLSGTGFYSTHPASTDERFQMPTNWVASQNLQSEAQQGDVQIYALDAEGKKAMNAYEVLLRAALQDDVEYFVDLREVLECWRIFDGILEDASRKALKLYRVGASPSEELGASEIEQQKDEL